MGLRDWFRRREQDTAPIIAQEAAEDALERTRAAAQEAKQKNDQMERRIEQNHFGEALVAAWSGRAG